MRLAHREHLNAVKFASTDETRYILNGVLMTETETGLRAVATDGKRLAVVESTGGMVAEDFPNVPGMDTAPNTAKSAIVPSECIDKVRRSLPKKNKLPVLGTALVKLGESQSTLCTTDLSNASVVPTRNIEGTFPNWEQVLPKEEPKFRIGVNPALLRELLEVAESNSRKGVAVCMEFWSENEPMRVCTDNGHGIKTTLILMPMKI